MTDQLTLGVIGHVDHGKTALVRALTGIETDRLKEEQERGLSIVLGFSYLESEGRIIDLIDVPGHEDFIRTMISGATGIDGVLAIIAANEGIMPQTREHLDIAQLLGVERGIVVVTKVDLVSKDELEAVEQEIRTHLRGGFLEHAEIVEASAVDGRGLDELRAALAGLSEAVAPRQVRDEYFLPVDRSFAMLGFGAVVTGTLRRGVIRVNDEVEILPWGGAASVRGLQVHNQSTKEARAGQRVAVNLRNLKRGEIRRGDTLASPGFLKTTRRIDAEIRLLPDQKQGLKNGVAIRVLFGTTEVIAKVRLLDQRQLEPGETGLVQLRCQSEVSTHRTERFIVRNCSPVVTIGGGRFLDLDPQRHRRFDTAVTERLRSTAGGDAADSAQRTVEAAGTHGVEIGTLREKLGLEEAELSTLVPKLDAVDVGGRLVDRSSYEALVAEIVTAVASYHASNPKQRGIASGSLRSGLGSNMHDSVFQHAVAALVSDNRLREESGIYRDSEFDPLANLSENERGVASEIEEIFRSGGLAPPPVESVLRTRPAHRSLYKLLTDTGQIVPLRTYDRDNTMALHRETLQQVEQVLRANYPYPKDFAVSEVRDLLGATRKYVVPLMEHLDATGVTVRTGNVRRLRDH